MLLLVAVVGPAVWRAFEFITESCEWSAADHARLESVPVDEFLGHDVAAGRAHCSESPPHDLIMAVQLDAPAALPDGWQQRASVGEWLLAGRNPRSTRSVLCYTSTEERFADVQVKLWSDGLVEATISRDRQRCGGFDAAA
jgi:hypothetical protein